MEKTLLEKRNDLIVRAEAVLNKAKEEKRELTEDEAQELAEIRDDVKKIKETLELKGFFDKEETEEMKPEEIKEVEETETNETETRSVEKAEHDAFEGFLRGKLNERANNLTPASGSGQVLIPVTIAQKIIKKVYDICPILERSTKYNVKGKLEIPYYDESETAITVAYAAEFSPLASNVGAFTKVELSGYLAGALALVSRSLINNSQFDIVGFVVDQMAYKIAMFIEDQLLNGYVPSGAAAGVVGLSTLSNTKTAAATGAVTANELIELQAQVKDVYQNNAIWIMSTATRTAIRELKDNVGRYLLQDDISAPFGRTLLGKPVYVSDNMPNMGASKRAIYYGDMSGLATKFNEDINIEVLRERYADQHAIGVIGWLEFDGKVEDAQKIACLVMAAS